MNADDGATERTQHPGASWRDSNRLLPSEPRTQAIAVDLYEAVAAKPILSPHGHVPASLLLDDLPFGNPAELLVVDDHYVTRLLHATGTDLSMLKPSLGADPRDIWRRLARSWHAFAGTASGYWLEEELAGVFGLRMPESPEEADRSYDEIEAMLSQPDYRPRALFERFGIEVLATTDDPLDDLARHAALRDAGLSGRVVPTFRPDRYLDPDSPEFPSAVERLLSTTGNAGDFAGYLDALQQRRAHFIAHGAVSTDHGVEEPDTLDLAPSDAGALFSAVLENRATPEERRAFRGHMLFQMARMSVEDGLVMTIHAGILRNHSTATFERFGPDTGHDIPVPMSYVRGLRPLLERFGLERDLHLVLFTADETLYSREIAPLAGFYPSVYIGAPWWFLDAPDAIARFRSATTETAGFYRYSGFVDDTRAFLSIPARHDTARRADAAYLARLVAEGRVSFSRAERIAVDLVDSIPRQVFKL